MRQSNTSSTDENDRPPPNLPKPRVSPLALHYMDMFDPTKADRKYPTNLEQNVVNGYFENEIYKKIKPSFPPPVNIGFPVYPNFPMPVPPSQNYTLNPFMSNLKPLSMFNEEAKHFQKAQSMNYLKDMMQLQNQAIAYEQQALSNFQRIHLKQEDIKIEEYKINTNTLSPPRIRSNIKNIKSGDFGLNRSLSDNNQDSNGEKIRVEEPALVELTKEFPEWDLATIFEYIQSGKARNIFEKERQFRLERKLKRRRNRTKFDNSNRMKSKIKEDVDFTEDYRPPRSAKGVQDLEILNGGAQPLKMKLRKEKCKQEEL